MTAAAIGANQVPCKVCGHPYDMTRQHEAVWGIFNEFSRRLGFASLRREEVGVCSPKCYAAHQLELSRPMQEYLARDRERAAQFAEQQERSKFLAKRKGPRP